MKLLDIRKYNIVSKIALMIIASIIFSSCSNGANPKWIQDLDYDESQVYSITFNKYNEPEVPVKINDEKFKVIFDTGNSEGFSLTTAIQDKVKYLLIGNVTERYADGTYRGESKLVRISKLELFGQSFDNVESTVSDWKMYGDLRFNGLLGLKFFHNKIVTIDYGNEKIGISNKSLIGEKVNKDNFIIIPLLVPPKQQDSLIYFEGEINQNKCSIYLDTGYSHSFVDPRILNETELKDYKNGQCDFLKVAIGDQSYQFKNLRIKEIERGTNFQFPVRLIIGSDILKANNFILTIDKIDNRLIIHKTINVENKDK